MHRQVRRAENRFLLPGAMALQSQQTALGRDSSKEEVPGQVGRVHRASLPGMVGNGFGLKDQSKLPAAVMANFCLFCRPGSELPGDPLEVIQLQRGARRQEHRHPMMESDLS